MIATAMLPFWGELQARAEAGLPALAAGALVLGAGVLTGWLAGRIVVRALGKEAAAWSVGGAIVGGLEGWDRRLVIGRSVQWLIIFSSTIVALYAVDPRLASILAERVLLYLPRLVSGLAIAVGGVLLSKFAGRAVLIGAVNHDIHPARLLAALTRTAVVIIGIAVALEHAGDRRAHDARRVRHPLWGPHAGRVNRRRARAAGASPALVVAPGECRVEAAARGGDAAPCVASDARICG